MPVRLVPASALLLLLATGCAGARPASARAGGRVVVLAASEAARPRAQSLTAELMGEEEPRDVLAREAGAALRARGRTVLSVHVAPEASGALEAGARELAVRHGADATLLVVLRRMDLSALQATGRAQVELHARLVSATGEALWDADRSVSTSVRLYRAQADWRSHLRQAVVTVLGELP
jgi:hypothetical protein